LRQIDALQHVLRAERGDAEGEQQAGGADSR